ncbi:hypothetical protein GCM10009087_27970 [Sphingomonas oligophenolica]|uniref:DUF5818 domain-containing protein n=1 Tax=Sphingomonas oligophenolica TaxID=301154 RepID=A0ABU9Y4P2_9SPHN
MRNAIHASPTPCHEIGTLVGKGECYALRCADGAETWLELDRIPMHLIDQRVRITGLRYSLDFISVEGIGPV